MVFGYRLSGSNVDLTFVSEVEAAMALTRLACSRNLVVGRWPTQWTDNTVVGAHEPDLDEMFSQFAVRAVFEEGV